MPNRFKCIIEFVLFCIPVILMIVLFSTKSHSTRTEIDVENVTTVKEHIIVGDVYIVCLNGVKYYYVEDGISKLGLAPVYGTDGQIILCKKR